jgi:putative peptide maturation dehydrogenase
VPQGEWSEAEPSGLVDELCGRGLLLREGDSKLQRREEQLAADQWLPAAAAYHFSTKQRGGDLRLPEDASEIATQADVAVERFVERYGPAPEPFHSVEGARVELPLVSGKGGLYDALGRRRTTRGFAERPVAREELAVLLHETFGCRGYLELHPEVVALRKSSPSAGGLHPIEAYPLIRSVDGLEPGLYHYAVRDHSLERLSSLEDGEARAEVVAFTAGQTYFASTAVAVVLTARFARSFWKYRRSPTAYATLLMDAGHLSQTFYLVCAQLGLGAFLTTLINGGQIEERLGLDGSAEGALAVLGCGVPAAERSPLEPEFTPYVPRETAI